MRVNNYKKLKTTSRKSKQKSKPVTQRDTTEKLPEPNLIQETIRIFLGKDKENKKHTYTPAKSADTSVLPNHFKTFFFITLAANAVIVNTGYNTILNLLHNEGYALNLSALIIIIMEIISITALFTTIKGVIVQGLFALGAYGLAAIGIAQGADPFSMFLLLAYGSCVVIGQVTCFILFGIFDLD